MIIYIGNFRPSFSTETYVARSFADIGVPVLRMQEDETTSEAVIRKVDSCFRGNDNAEPDVVLYTRTWRLKDGKDAAFCVWDALRRVGIPTATLSLDLYWGINREHMIGSDPMWMTDIVFTADGGRELEFRARGINHFWLPPAAFAGEC